jgi:hypothetical protein
MDITDVLQNTVWACCSGVIDDENVIDISGVKGEGLMTDFSSVCRNTSVMVPEIGEPMATTVSGL